MVKLKLCGITRSEDFILAGKLGIDFAGFVFVPGSPRRISPHMAKMIISENSSTSSPVPVGVFADMAASEIRWICSEAGIPVAQLHGRESLAFCRKLKMDFWKAVTSEDEFHRYPESVCSTILLDASGVERTGASISKTLAEKVLTSTGRKVIIAGGLGEENIEEILRLKPWGVDFSSSVEEKPGLKNHKKLRNLIEKIRGNQSER